MDCRAARGLAAPAREVQVQYYEAVKTSTRAYLASLTTADLDKPVIVHREPIHLSRRHPGGHGVDILRMAGRSPT